MQTPRPQRPQPDDLIAIRRELEQADILIVAALLELLVATELVRRSIADFVAHSRKRDHDA